MITDDSGNSATKNITISTPTVIITPTTAAPGASVQVSGSGFLAVASTGYFVSFDGNIQTTAGGTTTPTSGTGSIAVFFTVPTTATTGSHTVTLADSNGNTASATLNITQGGSSGFTIDTATLSSTAQSVNPSTGAAQSSFARGSSVKFTFVLDSTVGTGSTVWKITVQASDLSVPLPITASSASVSTTASTSFYQATLPASAPAGTWTAQIQIFASDGVTPLAVTTVTFTVT